MRYRLDIAYDGTDFCGWQRQFATPTASPALILPAASPDARAELRTVQALVEHAVREAVREPVTVVGASRTDSGVHALAQCAAFSTTDDRRGPADERLALAINARLPDDVVVTRCVPAHPRFDPIGHCAAKGYRYLLHNAHDKPLWNRRYVHHIVPPLDLDAMRDAAARLVGTHDFAAFAAAGHGRASTVRTVFACDAARLDERTIAIDISGDGFLWNMVRIVAGTLMHAGLGRLTPDDVSAALASRDRRLAGPTLPPTGLRLEWIRYPAGVEQPDADLPEPHSGRDEEQSQEHPPADTISTA